MRKLVVVLCLLVSLSSPGCRSSSFGNSAHGVMRGQPRSFAPRSTERTPVYATPPLRREWSREDEEAFRETMLIMARIGMVVALEVLQNQRAR